MKRPYYLCGHCGEGQFPVDQELDVAEVLAVIRKRSFWGIGRERLAGLVQLEADAVGCGSELLLG